MKRLTLVGAMVVGLALPASAQITTTDWDSSYEGKPLSTDPVSEGDDNITGLKQELRGRLDTEMCFGTTGAGGSGCGNSSGTPTDATKQDSGRHRQGSARVFFATTCPATNLNGTDDDASAVLDDGRLCVDFDTNQLFVQDAGTDDGLTGGGWEATTFGGLTDLTDVTITSAADNEILRYDATDSMWEDYAALFRSVDTGTSAALNIAVAQATPARITLANGADVTVSGDPAVTVPDAAATVPGADRWTIVVTGSTSWYHNATVTVGSLLIQIEERCAASTSTPAVGSGTIVREYQAYAFTNNGGSIGFHYVNNAPTAGNTCAYTVLAADDNGASGDGSMQLCPDNTTNGSLVFADGAGAGNNNCTYLDVQLIPRGGLD